MTAILFVRLSGFLLREVRKSQAPEAREMALVVHDGHHVLEACPKAVAKGIGAGMAVKESKTLLREEGRHEKPKEEDLREAAERWLDLCSECSSVVEPVSPREAFVDLSSHPDPPRVAGELLALLHQREGLELDASLTPLKWLSQRAALPCDSRALGLGLLPFEPVTDAPSAVAALPLSLVPLPDSRLVERLEFLGCRFVHQALQLSPQVLKKQFGAEAARLSALFRGLGGEKVKALHPPDSLEVALKLEGPVEDAHMVDQALAILAQKLAVVLSSRDRQAEALTLTAYHEEGPWTSWRRRLGKPIVSSSLLLVAFRKMLEDRPPASPLVRFIARAERLSLRSSWQASLDGSLPAAQQQAALRSATRMVEAMFGEGKLTPASQMSVPRRLRVLKAWRHATGWH